MFLAGGFIMDQKISNTLLLSNEARLLKEAMDRLSASQPALCELIATSGAVAQASVVLQPFLEDIRLVTAGSTCYGKSESEA
jgi:uncharacterized protein YfaA (DUF2138 family)